MSREVIHIQVGQCGNQVGSTFWELIATEHGLNWTGNYEGNDSAQLEKIDVFYCEDKNQYTPRCVLIDTERTVLNFIQTKPYGGIFRPDNIICGTEGASNQFLKGFYSDYARQALESIRQEAEKCGCLQGMSFTHATGGGTGSGLGMKLFTLINDVLSPSRACAYSFAVFPSKRISNVIVESYNTVMTLDKMKDVENVVVFDNESLHRICVETLGLKDPGYSDLNYLMALVMAGTTASIRFPGQHNMDLNKLSYSLRCRSFLHYYVPSFSPLMSPAKRNTMNKLTVDDLLRQMVRDDMFMCEFPADEEELKLRGDSYIGKTFARASLFRGAVPTYAVENAMTFLKPKSSVEDLCRETLEYNSRINNQLSPLNPLKSSVMKRMGSIQNRRQLNSFSATDYNHFDYEELRNPRKQFTSICNYAGPGYPLSVTSLLNTSAIKHKFRKIINEANYMYDTAAFLTWYNSNEFGNDESASLESAIKSLSDKWLTEFGVEDESDWMNPVINVINQTDVDATTASSNNATTQPGSDNLSVNTQPTATDNTVINNDTEPTATS